MIQPTNYVRKPFYVEAVQVTEDNFHEVAEWCGGEILRAKPPVSMQLGDEEVPYIRVPVTRPTVLADRQAQAFVGNWVVKAGASFKIYPTKAFVGSFEDSPELPCGWRENTLDHKPCVLGQGHRKGPHPIGCRSFQDYLEK